jgi:MerR family transcriptional regulator, copper efflux regulator
MRITEAAGRLGTSPRMLRYREMLGLLPPVGGTGRRSAPSHRHFDEDDLATVEMGLALERRYDVSPAAVAFGMRVLTDPGLRAELAELGRRIGRIPPPPVRALEFEKERALRLLSLAPAGAGLTGGGGGGPRVSPGPSRRPGPPGTDPAPGRSSPRSAPRP